MKSVETEVGLKILETLKELTSDGIIPGRRKESAAEFEEEDRLVFLFLEEELNRRGISELSQLPIGGEKSVVQFANNLPTATTLFTILQKLEFTECIPFPTLSSLHYKVTLPSRSRFTSPSRYFTGTCYHALLDQSTFEDGIFDIGDLIYPTVIGFALPQHLNPTRIGKIYDKFRIFRSPGHYASTRHQELGLPLLSATGFKCKAEPKLGNNIGHKKPYGDIAFTFVREYRQFSTNINAPTTPLQSAFVTKVKELTTGDNGRGHGISDEAWSEFFYTYGTHVITKANGGGRIVLTILENHLKNYFGVNDLSRSDKVDEIEQVLTNILDGDGSVHDTVPNWQASGGLQASRNLLISSIRLEGGDLSFANLDLTTCHKPGERKNIISKWSQTLPFSPIMLDSTITIESISNILEYHGFSNEAKLVDLATQRLFGKSFWKATNTKSEGRSWGW